MVPQREDDEDFKLQYISTGILSTNELSILQAKKETVVYAEHVHKMIGLIQILLLSGNEKKLYKTIDKIKKLESVSDQIEEEIANYLTKLTEESLSKRSSEKINLILFTISSLESIADSCNNIGNTFIRKQEQKIDLQNDSNKNLLNLLEMVDEQFKLVKENISSEESKMYENSVKLEAKIQKLLDNLRNDHFKDLKKGKYKCKDGIIYSDLYSDIAKIGNFAFEINKFIKEYNEDSKS